MKALVFVPTVVVCLAVFFAVLGFVHCAQVPHVPDIDDAEGTTIESGNGARVDGVAGESVEELVQRLSKDFDEHERELRAAQAVELEHLEIPLSSDWIHALDPAQNLGDVARGWVPTEFAFELHVRPLLGLGYLTLEQARELLHDRDDLLATLQGSGTLGERIGMPTDEDVAELWRAESTPGFFARALWAWQYADAIDCIDAPDPVAAGIARDSYERQGRTSWLAVFDAQRQGYRWWPLLAELGLRIEYGEQR